MDQDLQTNNDQADQSSATPKQRVIERLREATNVLVTVKSNPSVDELAATIGLTLMLNKLDKHTTAVFSGAVPSTLEFLKPDETIETNTDSLRDFIVSLDKSKADKLRYKVEENVVKIFITPYRTSITESDLEFTQGDFNVDAVVALGVTKREELDNAITAHGRILHDATFITVTSGQDISELGQINWQDEAASSLCEMLVSISEAFQGGLIDTQIATAFLTGIVAETQRFSNPKTTPKVMTMSAQLMAAGANQQLIANELEKAGPINNVNLSNTETINNNAQNNSPESSDGSLTIPHDKDVVAETKPITIEDLESKHKTNQKVDSNQSSLEENSEDIPRNSESNLSENLFLNNQDTQTDPNSRLYSTTYGQPIENNNQQNVQQATKTDTSQGILPPLNNEDEKLPTLDTNDLSESDASVQIDTEGNLLRKAATQPKHKVVQPLSNDQVPLTPNPEVPQMPDTLPAPQQPLNESFPNDLGKTPEIPIEDNTTLAQIEKAVDSPHLQQPETADIDQARNAVFDALGQSADTPADLPRADLNAMPLSAPPEVTSYDSYRLPDSSQPESVVNDVSGNLPDASLNLPPVNPDNFNDQSAPNNPPPVPPPMFPPNQAL